MGSDIAPELLPEIITAVIAVLIYWIKRSMDKGLDEIKTSLTNINNNITSSTQVVNIHQYQPPERIKPELEEIEVNEGESVGY